MTFCTISTARLSPMEAHPKKHLEKLGRLFLLVSLFTYSTSQLRASTTAAATAGHLINWAGAGPNATPGSATWRFSDPTATDNINWKSGTNEADGSTFDHTIAPETKFSFTGVAPAITITGIPAWKGFSFNDCSVAKSGSCATTSGAGGSVYTKPKATATWTVTAGGKLGPGPSPSYDSIASGDDPWFLPASDVSLTDPFSLFFAFELQSAFVSPSGTVDYNVMYSTASGSLDILDVTLDSTGAHVSSPALSLGDVSIYMVPSVDVDPRTFTATALTLSQLQSMVQSDFAGNSLASPIMLGFILNNQSAPTIDMGGGMVARIDDTATATESGLGGTASVPEPSTISMFVCGAGCLVLGCFRRRPRREL